MKAKDAKKFQIDGEQVIYVSEHLSPSYIESTNWTVVDYRDVETKTEQIKMRPTDSAIEFEVNKGKKLVGIEKGTFSIATVTFEVETPKSYTFKTGKEAYRKARELMQKYN